MMEKPPALKSLDRALPEDLQTLDASDLGKLLGRSTKTIKNDAQRRPESLPPRWCPPGYKRHKPLWRVVDVRKWMQALADIQADERMQARELARKQGIKHVPYKPITIAKVSLGTAATHRMKEDE